MAVVIRDAHFPGRAPIEEYGRGGFFFAGMSHRGGILCLPSGIYGWKEAPETAQGIDADSLARVFAEAEKIELLIVGTGRDIVALSTAVRERCREANLKVEQMATGAAVRTFNVLLAEDRAVAAALLPVE